MRIEDPTPGHVMWPDKGSGFEASPWSPAGRAQQMWIIAGNLRRYPKKVPLWPLVAVPLGAFAVIGFVALIVEAIGRLF